jgi:hypothetical protein
MFDDTFDDIYNGGLPPSGTKEAVAILQNNKRRETIMVQYRYDNRELSITTMSHREIEREKKRMAGHVITDPAEFDIATSHHGSFKMFDKLVEYYAKQHGFVVEHYGIQVY